MQPWKEEDWDSRISSRGQLICLSFNEAEDFRPLPWSLQLADSVTNTVKEDLTFQKPLFKCNYRPWNQADTAEGTRPEEAENSNEASAKADSGSGRNNSFFQMEQKLG